MSNPEVGTLDGIDGIADVGKFDKCAVPFFEEIDELEIAILLKSRFGLSLACPSQSLRCCQYTGY
jgi:hypothetical protein